MRSSAARRSRAVCHRSSGSFARQRRNTQSSAGIAVSVTGGSRSMIAAVTIAGFAPSNARLPVSIWNNTQPNEKMSERASVTFPCSCSGAM